MFRSIGAEREIARSKSAGSAICRHWQFWNERKGKSVGDISFFAQASKWTKYAFGGIGAFGWICDAFITLSLLYDEIYRAHLALLPYRHYGDLVRWWLDVLKRYFLSKLFENYFWLERRLSIPFISNKCTGSYDRLAVALATKHGLFSIFVQIIKKKRNIQGFIYDCKNLGVHKPFFSDMWRRNWQTLTKYSFSPWILAPCR